MQKAKIAATHDLFSVSLRFLTKCTVCVSDELFPVYGAQLSANLQRN